MSHDTSRPPNPPQASPPLTDAAGDAADPAGPPALAPGGGRESALQAADPRRADSGHSEIRLRAIADSAQDAILMMDPSGRISYWNLAAERILGYARAEALGQNLHAFIAPSRHHAAHQAAFPGFLRTGQGNAVGKTLDLEARRKDGQEIPVQLSLSAVYFDGGWHAVGVLRDITAAKQSEARLRETNRRLEEASAQARTLALQAEQASAAKSEFLANMSHEIRTPLNGVIGLTGLLLDSALTAEQRHYAAQARESGECLLTLVNDILDLSKIEAGKLDLESVPCDPGAVLADCAAAMAFRACEKGLALLHHTDPEVPATVWGDPGRLRQALTNLAANAIKFTQAGEVVLRVSLDAAHPDTVRLRFSVRDTGIGIPADKLGLLFHKFSQVDSSTTREYGGTGLGLAIVKQLATLMGGEVGVRSEPGRGSEFWFTARLRRQPEAGLAGSDRSSHRSNGPDPAAAPFAGTGTRVLLVEDNPTNQLVAAGILRKLGIQPEIAPNGAEALRALESEPFALVLMDVQMPVMDGLEATRRLRDPQSAVLDRHIPVVAMTAHAMQGDKAQCLQAGMNDYLTKPISVPALVETLRRWIPCATLPSGPDRTCQGPADAPTPQPAAYDLQALRERLMGDDALARRIAEAFLADLPQQIRVLTERLGQGDSTGAGRQAHTIKGAAANMGAEALREQAARMEQAGRAGNLDSMRTGLPELESRFRQLEAAMRLALRAR